MSKETNKDKKQTLCDLVDWGSFSISVEDASMAKTIKRILKTIWLKKHKNLQFSGEYSSDKEISHIINLYPTVVDEISGLCLKPYHILNFSVGRLGYLEIQGTYRDQKYKIRFDSGDDEE